MEAPWAQKPLSLPGSAAARGKSVRFTDDEDEDLGFFGCLICPVLGF